MVSELGLVGGPGFECLFAIYFLFVDLNVLGRRLCLVYLTLHVWVWGCT